jgi:hypothetical protein
MKKHHPMTAIENIMKFAGKRQIEIRQKAKEKAKAKALDISNAVKQKHEAPDVYGWVQI